MPACGDAGRRDFCDNATTMLAYDRENAGFRFEKVRGRRRGQRRAVHGPPMPRTRRRRFARPLALATTLSAASWVGTACFSGKPDAANRCAEASSELETCPRSTVVRGIDVSIYQGAIDWRQVRTAGIAFGIARISDGTTVPDARFAENWRAMKAAGVVRGAYQYFRASEDPVAQASLVVATLDSAGGLSADDLPVVLDLETADRQPSQLVRTNMQSWLATIDAATGRPAMIYTNAATAATIGAGFGGYVLWVANWQATCPTMPLGWSMWKFWQYASDGTVPGVSDAVDLDEFDGTLSDLISFGSGGAFDAGLGDLGDAADGALAWDVETETGRDSSAAETARADAGAHGSAMGASGAAPCAP